VSCAEGETGRVYEGKIPFEMTRVATTTLARPRTAIMVNLGNPDLAFRTAMLPNEGVGLARMEFIISEHIGIHPMALAQPGKVTSEDDRKAIAKLAGRYERPADFFIEKLSEGVGTIAAALLSEARDYPPVRFQDERIREADRRRRLRTEGREPDARLPRRVSLRSSSLRRGLRSRMRCAETRPRPIWG